MENKTEINQNIKAAFNSLKQIQKVPVSGNFTSSVLDKIKLKEDKTLYVTRWFSPQLQIAAISLILLLNLGAIIYSVNTTDVKNINSSDIELFAREYALQPNNFTLN